MAVRQSEQSPWPSQTSGPSTSHARPKQKTNCRRGSSVAPRQTADAAAIEQAKTQCQVFSGNQIISCFPTSDVIVPQHEWAGFVWNSRRPQITQTDLVDIYVFHADSLQQILHFPNVSNPTNQAGYITAPVNDTWFGARGLQWNGSNISLPFYWVVTSSGQILDGSEIPQSTFTAVQTTMLDSVTSSIASSSSSAAAAASLAALSSSLASVASASASASRSTSGSNPGGIQSANSASPFPHWAIAVIVVLGFLALVAGGILAFFIVRRLRRRDDSSNRGSMASASPMIVDAQAHSPRLPLLGGVGLATVGTGAAGSGHRASSVASPDAASSISHGGSAGDGPFSGADAAIMADAFRKALRKPDFADNPVEEGESPGSQQPNNAELLSRELAEEGRDIRSVESSRGVQVETLGDTGRTVQDR